MGEWNYNQYGSGGYPWEGNRENAGRPPPEMQYYPVQRQTNNQPQYIGFQDFLNQYQQQPTYQNFPIDYHNHQQQNLSGNYLGMQSADVNFAYQHNSQQPNYGVPLGNESMRNKVPIRNTSAPITDPRVPFDSLPGQARQARDLPTNLNTRYNSKTNKQNASSDANLGIESKPEILFQSKLTPTALEFVPQGSTTETQASSSVNPNRNDRTDYKKNTEMSRREEKNKSASPSGYKSKNDVNKNINWRQKKDDSSPSSLNIPSFVFENQSNNRNTPTGVEPAQNSYANRGESSGRYKKEPRVKQNAEPSYNDSNRGYKNTRQQNSNNRYNSETDNAKFPYRQKSSYTSAESFRQNSAESFRQGTGESFRQNEYYRQNSNESFRQNAGESTRKNSNESYRPRNESRRYDHYYNKENYEDDNKRKNKNATSNQSYRKKDFPIILKDIDGVEVSQRERLTEQLNKGRLECLVCCELIRQSDSIWSCGNCFHVLHLQCIIKWAKSSLSDGMWRCPACQNNNSTVPNKYKCFCGKHINPDWIRGGDSAHTCGNICGRLPVSCLRHPCTLLCHAGPCPQCDAVVKKKCECGATTQSLKCSSTQPLLCGQICNKPLNCQVHQCEEKCHPGSCQPCKLTVDQECYCMRGVKRTLPCDSSTVGISNFSCGDVCDKELECGNHKCKMICHKDRCDECELLPKNVKMCPCGQTTLKPEQMRNSCLDEIPLCEKICSKQFKCGPPDNQHVCGKPCHHGECPDCPDKTVVSCRCGNINSDILCVNLEKQKDNVRCKKKCSKKQSCGRHRCKVLCCIDTEHRCPLPCNRTLSCGLHKCEDTCHSGHCDPCWRTNFDELRCRCGEAIRFPPIPCGARPPVCSLDCSVARPCGHPVLHTCHPEPTSCPPCTVLTQRYCHGRHKMRKTIPCHQEEFSCGLPCGKELSCTKHKCIEICHKGNCPTVCSQQCEVIRATCGHTCGAACGHPDPCPVAIPCKRPVNVSCLCGRRTAVKTCSDHMRELHRLQASTGMLEGSMGKPIDIKALIAKGNTTTIMDCDDECYVEERNRRMAIGLQIRNPDISSKLTPRYSEFMKQFAARDEPFCVKVHEKLTELVLLAQKSIQKTRSNSFQPMNHSKRQFVHEYCEHFGCDSKAYDSEPHRNIVATAYREKSWLPALSLMEVIRRDKGQRRVPGPVVGSSAAASTSGSQTKTNICGSGAWATLNTNFGSSSSESTRQASSTLVGVDSVTPQEPRKPKIDYFDAPPDFN